MPRVPRRLALGVLLGALVVGCLSPTLPLPPPSKPDIEGPNEQGMVILTGTLPHPHAHAHAFNAPHGQSFLTGDDAAYVLVLPAAIGDEVQFWYEIGKQKSPTIMFRIPPLPDTPDAASTQSDAGAEGGNDSGADGG